jgi:hypothetical protein
MYAPRGLAKMFSNYAWKKPNLLKSKADKLMQFQPKNFPPTVLEIT